MNITLYLNTYLASSGVMKLNGSRPIYPSIGSLDANNKVDVLRLQLKSMSEIGFKNAVINIGSDLEYADEVANLVSELPSILYNTNILSDENRPSTREEWLKSLENLKSLIDHSELVLCMFNHDHIFVEYNTHIFKKLVFNFFNKYSDGYLYYSHAPEVLSSTFFQKEYLSRLFKANRINLKQSVVRNLEFGLSVRSSFEYIDGIFLTSVAGLEYLWRNAEIHTSYVPRPDWPGVSHKQSKFLVGTANREFFRHFDGYGHVTNLPSMLGMRFADFSINSRLLKRENIKTIYDSKIYDDKNIIDLSWLYVDLFKDIHLLALRDFLYAYKNGDEISIAIKHAFSLLHENLISAYVIPDAETYGMAEEDLSRLNLCVSNNLYCLENELLKDVFSDLMAT